MSLEKFLKSDKKSKAIKQEKKEKAELQPDIKPISMASPPKKQCYYFTPLLTSLFEEPLHHKTENHHLNAWLMMHPLIPFYLNMLQQKYQKKGTPPNENEIKELLGVTIDMATILSQFFK